MKEGAIALGKVRGYCYLIFLFDILILFHSEIAEFFGTTDKKILYGFTAIILFQAVLSVLYVVKYVTTVGQKYKKRKRDYNVRCSLKVLLYGYVSVSRRNYL